MPFMCFSNSIIATSRLNKINLQVPYAGVHDVVRVQSPFELFHELVVMFGPVFCHHSGAPALMAIRIPSVRTCKVRSIGKSLLHNLLRTFVFSLYPKDVRDYPAGRLGRNYPLVSTEFDTCLIKPVMNPL